MPAEWFCCRFFVPESEQENLILLLLQEGFTGFEQQQDCLIAYGPASLKNTVPEALLSAIPHETELLPHRNWNALWEQNYPPVRLGDVLIRAPHHPPDPEARTDLIIVPAQAFGTGHHATTRLCLEALARIPLQGKKVIDFGCGTGILAIYAAKRGASVFAVEADADALKCARQNCDINQVNHSITLWHGDTLPNGAEADVVVANLDLQTLLVKLTRLASVVKAGNVLLLSGILSNQDAGLIEAAGYEGLLIQEVHHSEGWALVKLGRR